jgi:hypothetical protein
MLGERGERVSVFEEPRDVLEEDKAGAGAVDGVGEVVDEPPVVAGASAFPERGERLAGETRSEGCRRVGFGTSRGG